MADISILIVEDELIIAEDIKNQLHTLGYKTSGIAKSYNQAIDLLNKSLPDLILVDVKLKGVKDGIDLAYTVKEMYRLPIVFLTSHADKITVNRAKKVMPEGYLVKPFEKDDLFTSIEMAFSNYMGRMSNITKKSDDEPRIINNCIFVRKDHLLIKISFQELKWIKAEGNYLELHCVDNCILTRSTLKDFLHKLPNEMYVQVHRSYVVNKNFISVLDFNKLTIDSDEIPVGRSFLQSVREVLS